MCVRRWAVVALALALLGAAACSSKSGSDACPGAAGTYTLAVAATGQSENDDTICAQQLAGAVDIPVTLTATTASFGGEDCVVRSTLGCQIEIDCLSTDGGVQAVGQMAVQHATFVVPTSPGQPTENALVELGPGDCAFEGTASIAQSMQASSSGH